MIAIILASVSIYVINVYNTVFFGGLVSGFLSAIAFGLLVTLIWLYLEILRLLAKLNSRR